MTGLTSAQETALRHARHLAESGVPLFVAQPDARHKVGFRLPKGWQLTVPDVSVVDGWRPGMALCAVMGFVVDAVDVDTHKGGDASLEAMRVEGVLPRSYGRQRTPSGGVHDLVATLGVHSRDGIRTGVDVKAGVAGQGHGFVFLAPTERPSKVTGEMVAYEWAVAPDLSEVVLIGGDESGAALADEIQRARPRPTVAAATQDGPGYADLSTAEQDWADREQARQLDWWRDRLADAMDWPEGETDDFGRGWERLARDLAWTLAAVAATPWTPLAPEEAGDVYARMLPEGFAAVGYLDKWSDQLIGKAAAQGAEPPPWLDFAPLDSGREDAPAASGTARLVNVTNPADAFDWLCREAGTYGLAGLFRRGSDLVHTPRVGEHGYVPPDEDTGSDDGPAQVRRVSSVELAARVDMRCTVVRATRTGQTTRAMFPLEAANRAVAVVDDLPNLRTLRGVTHTPVVRNDGSVLDVPGYDAATGLLYLPDVGLNMPAVPERPSRADVVAAGSLLLEMVDEFPFVTTHDRANYLGAMLTPLLRPVVPPPYKLVAIGAPQAGSGKSLLAALLRGVHGGVFKAEFPKGEEVRKVITSTLEYTSAPVVQFDNVRGLLKSSDLEALLTDATWTDRPLGRNGIVSVPNDRLWVATGNNLKIGGDLGRRTLWITINAKVPEPEKRTHFVIRDLEGWARERRGALLAALLTLVRGWVVAGKPQRAAPTSDSFGAWLAALRGILAFADLGDEVGTVGHEDSVKGDADEENDEWAAFLTVLADQFGDRPWTASQVLGRTVDDFKLVDDKESLRTIDAALLPGDLADKAMRGGTAGATKSLGRWLMNREDRWAGGLSVRRAGSDSRKTTLWQVVRADS